jgi:hypothetical protein
MRRVVGLFVALTSVVAGCATDPGGGGSEGKADDWSCDEEPFCSGAGPDPYYEDMGPDDVLCVEGTVRHGDWGGNATYVVTDAACQNRDGQDVDCRCPTFQIFGANSIGLFGMADGEPEVGGYTRIMNGHHIDAILGAALEQTAVLCPHPHMTPVLSEEYCEVFLATNDQGIEVVQYGFAWDWEGDRLVILDEGVPIAIPEDEIAIP